MYQSGCFFPFLFFLSVEAVGGGAHILKFHKGARAVGGDWMWDSSHAQGGETLHSAAPECWLIKRSTAMSKHDWINITESLRLESRNISKHVTCQVNLSLAPAQIIRAKSIFSPILAFRKYPVLSIISNTSCTMFVAQKQHLKIFK